MPHNLKQLEYRASKIKKPLRQYTQESSRSNDRAIDLLAKGCEIHMNSAILLSKEIQDLRAAHKKSQGKKKRSHQQISHTEDFYI